MQAVFALTIFGTKADFQGFVNETRTLAFLLYYILDTAVMKLEQAQIHIDAQGNVISKTFDDVYFSRAGAKEEFEYVFWNGNQLSERLSEAQHFSIAETGFGTGLNFLYTWDKWEKIAPQDARLHFISTEQFPLSPSDHQQLLSFHPELAEKGKELQAHLPLACEGFHKLSFADGKVTLTLLYGDAAKNLEQVSTKIDAWFLDGFAPKKNPEMWSEKIFSEMKRLSKKGTTFSSFTAASLVQKALEANGFKTEKKRGFGKKREMIFGHFCTDETKAKTWYFSPRFQASAKEKTVSIIGAGISGCITAHAFAKRGWKVHLFDEKTEANLFPEKHHAGVLFPNLSRTLNLHSQFYLTSYLFALRQLEDIQQTYSFEYHSCGMLYLASKAKDKNIFFELSEKIPKDFFHFVSSREASEIAGIQLKHDALYFPQGSWLFPKDLCKAILTNPNITLHPQSGIQNIKKENKFWKVSTKNDEYLSSCEVITNAYEAKQFEQTQWIPLQKIRGQVSFLHNEKALSQLKTILCYRGYLVPCSANLHMVGASFEPEKTNEALEHHSHLHNLALLKEHLSNIDIVKHENTLDGSVGFRSVAPDRMPIIGPAPNEKMFQEYFQSLKLKYTPPEELFHHGLYVNIAHASRGLLSSFMGAETIASLVCDEPSPLPQKLTECIHPIRFLLRKAMGRKTVF
ncbi:MAG: bifunctional tRNA (5-methylaminomethyl-2-thiouridine)(34)-methyltransferase MnmD/FAD-dependent 5-carboxymethylaminomethyl-2-thiouridine(34) oxidoreductase MnmC [Deltaproteobacteria bacterium CG_4_10_14_0_2_um_filter_43_8]|nr:MAG: bifunctional tRNA (5-methylaminomethyl-2-thiouridine)(34)-methyltransferase MnmD/FAD-dependent 5-carboxymethylaminomethyl-2-thiouridine(34) oxidoreductase MnmC [Deltaproteobacteria bacterium CG_4_10_14_0_2_um_filter_43_8]